MAMLDHAYGCLRCGWTDNRIGKAPPYVPRWSHDKFQCPECKYVQSYSKFMLRKKRMDHSE